MLYFGSNKYRLGEQKRLIFKNIKNVTVQKRLTGSVCVKKNKKIYIYARNQITVIYL